MDTDGVNHYKRAFDITDGLIRRSYSDPDIELILGGNFQRALAEAWVPAVALTQSTVPQALAQ